ncbi:hypothetical protein F183_A33400 [Bryobacterales bacterium F-183]|nr:hypothetical protein F183_A33400 [Bryobacterales bacterium F-183]
MPADYSRNTYRPERGYTSVRLQQGRVPLDADWNEQVDIEAGLRRAALIDLIGGACAPASLPDSFKVSLGGGFVRAAAGRMWVRGHLCQSDTQLRTQLPTAPGRYAVYLEAFERLITAIEDPEIREVALGGPDTAVRTKIELHLRVVPVPQNATCLSLQGAALPGQTTGRLTASTGQQPAATPCVVPAAAGYARLENQLYRVEVHRSGTVGATPGPTFIWSRDNSCITAEWLKLDGVEVVIPDAGRDDVLGFQDCRWVELSGEDADIDGVSGVLVEVIGRSTDADGHYRLQIDAHGQSVPDPSTLKHPKVRRWDHDSEIASGIDIPSGGAAVPLEGGIEVTFGAGFYREGDYWMFAARTFSGATIGDILWPRDPITNAPLSKPPDGVERFFARLALIDINPGALPSVEEDCRSVFPSLCGLKRNTSCCTVTVGPGGEVPTIALGLARLPDEGGEICLLPGVYRERIVLANRQDIVIHGCGGRVQIVAPDANPAISLTGCDRIVIRSLKVMAREGVAIDIQRSRDVVLRNLTVVARDHSAIHATRLDGLHLLDSEILVEAGEAEDSPRFAAVFTAGVDIRIEGNKIGPGRVRRGLPAAGGIQVGGGSRNVEICRNTVENGSGIGITLGSLSPVTLRPNFGSVFDSLVSTPVADPKVLAASASLKVGADHFGAVRPSPLRMDFERADGAVLLPRPLPGIRFVSDGDLSEILIADNEITGMGSSGIAVAQFLDVESTDADLITVTRLSITGNRITGCLRQQHAKVPQGLADDSALGGIALADVQDGLIRDNDIENNGKSITNGVCGIFLGHARGVDIHRNRIRHNGAASDPKQEVELELRGGIVISLATTPLVTVNASGAKAVLKPDGTPALRIHDNIVVAPAGRALDVLALGSVSVQGNQFTAQAGGGRKRPGTSPLGLGVPPGSPPSAFLDALAGAVVLIHNLGESFELRATVPDYSSLSLAGAQNGASTALPGRTPFIGGNIQYQDNQTLLDGVDRLSATVLSAVTLLTLDDVSASGNLSECKLVDDIAGMDLMVMGLSVRVTGNRLKEGVRTAFYSAGTLAYLNTTTDNQGTHCFVRVAPRVPPSQHENTVLIDQPLGSDGIACREALALQEKLRQQVFPDRG